MIEARSFSRVSLARTISECSGLPLHEVTRKWHFDYLSEYLSYQDALSLVIERPYIDRDFLEDFAGYYARCFHSYERFCSRIHFFKARVQQDKLEDAITSIRSQRYVAELDESYLGFVVIRPLPETIFGRTCLKPYPSIKRRNYPVKRAYTANVCGIELTVGALGYQEQDAVTAACATSALWVALQATSKLFQHKTPSPIEVTRLAQQYWPNEERIVPSQGMFEPQMSYIIHQFDLEPEAFSINNHEELAIYSLAYLRAGIPIVMLEHLCYVDERTNSITKHIGGHAVTIVGYSEVGSPLTPYTESACVLASTGVDRFYAHDDQIGPYARFWSRHSISDGPDSYHALRTTREGKDGRVYAIPFRIIVPLYHKIRLRLVHVLKAMVKLDSALKGALRENGFEEIDITWDAHLTSVNQLKNEIRRTSKLSQAARREFLLGFSSRYLWRVSLSIEGIHVTDLLLDATDVPRGKSPVTRIVYHAPLHNVLRIICTGMQVPPEEQANVDWLRRAFIA